MRARATIAWLLALGALLLAGCSAAPVVPSTQFPKPVLRQHPLALGLYMDAAFRDYVHQDRPAKGVAQDVSVGPASRTLFTEFLSAQFRSLSLLGSAPTTQSPAPGVQAVLQPMVLDVQIASPRTDQDEFHEAWIKYRLRLLTPQGVEITSWELAAYGKERSATLSSTNSGLTAAVREAMRDAAAGMALLFRDGNALRTRLAAAPAAATPEARP